MEVLKTIRVVNPNNPRTYMVINERDRRPSHQLWYEQDANFEALDPLETALSPEAQAAVRIFGKLTAQKVDLTGEQWANLTSAKRTELMLAQEPAIDAFLEQERLAKLSPVPELGVEDPQTNSTDNGVGDQQTPPPPGEAGKGANWKKPAK